jgi:hypothetical protein
VGGGRSQGELLVGRHHEGWWGWRCEEVTAAELGSRNVGEGTVHLQSTVVVVAHGHGSYKAD